MQKVDQLFVEKTENEETYLVLNSDLVLEFENEQQSARFLVESILFWIEKRRFFCHDNTKGWVGKGEERRCINLPEEKWSFSYKTPSTCGGCMSGQKILDKIFGNRQKFNSLPFVVYPGDRQYFFRFDLLEHFVENGHDSTICLIEEQKQERARKKTEAEVEQKRKFLEGQNAKLEDRLGDTLISDGLRRQILPHADNKSLIVVNQDIAVVLTSRSEWGSTGGIGYYDQVRVFCGSQSNLKEWQWRDRYDAYNDKPQLAVDGIGEVKLSEKDNEVSVEVELINNQHNNRSVTYTFDVSKLTTVRELSMDEQAIFTAQVEEEVSRIMTELDQLWNYKPQMVNPHPVSGFDTYVPYRRPSIKQKEFRPEIGIAAFVTEEQIDHRVSDAQIRHELHVLIVGSDQAKSKAEDHGYGREGGAFLKILEIEQNCIIINTKRGKSTIELTI